MIEAISILFSLREKNKGKGGAESEQRHSRSRHSRNPHAVTWEVANYCGAPSLIRPEASVEKRLGGREAHTDPSEPHHRPIETSDKREFAAGTRNPLISLLNESNQGNRNTLLADEERLRATLRASRY